MSSSRKMSTIQLMAGTRVLSRKKRTGTAQSFIKGQWRERHSTLVDASQSQGVWSLKHSKKCSKTTQNTRSCTTLIIHRLASRWLSHINATKTALWPWKFGVDPRWEPCAQTGRHYSEWSRRSLDQISGSPLQALSKDQTCPAIPTLSECSTSRSPKLSRREMICMLLSFSQWISKVTSQSLSWTKCRHLSF